MLGLSVGVAFHPFYGTPGCRNISVENHCYYEIRNKSTFTKSSNKNFVCSTFSNENQLRRVISILADDADDLSLMGGS
jgi:hypothetical protein